MRAIGIHDCNGTSDRLLLLCKTPGIPSATYGVDLTNRVRIMQHSWNVLEKGIISRCFGIFTSTPKSPLKTMADMEEVEHKSDTAATYMIRRIHQRAETLPKNKRAPPNKEILVKTKEILISCLGWSRKLVRAAFTKAKEVKRKLPQWEDNNTVQELAF